MIDTIEWWPLVVAGAIVLLPPIAIHRVTNERMAERWALERGVRLDADVVPQMQRHLRRTRIARTVGVTSGFALNLVLAGLLGSGRRSSWYSTVWVREFDPMFIAAGGYVIASIWAELTKPRTVTGSGAGVAVLASRRLRDFADVGVLRPLAWFATLAPVATVVWLAAPDPDPPVSSRLKEGSVVGCVGVAIVAVGAALAICRRRERAADEMGVAYEELTRSASVNALLGAAVAMVGGYSGQLLSSWSVFDWVSGWVAYPAVMVVSFLSIGVWYTAGTKFVFRSRRMDALREREARTVAA